MTGNHWCHEAELGYIKFEDGLRCSFQAPNQETQSSFESRRKARAKGMRSHTNCILKSWVREKTKDKSYSEWQERSPEEEQHFWLDTVWGYKK